MTAAVSRKLYVRLLAVSEKGGGANGGKPSPIVPENCYYFFCSFILKF